MIREAGALIAASHAASSTAAPAAEPSTSASAAAVVSFKPSPPEEPASRPRWPAALFPELGVPPGFEYTPAALALSMAICSAARNHKQQSGCCWHGTGQMHAQ